MSVNLGAKDMSTGNETKPVTKEHVIGLIRTSDLTENQLAQLKVQVEKFIDLNK